MPTNPTLSHLDIRIPNAIIVSPKLSRNVPGAIPSLKETTSLTDWINSQIIIGEIITSGGVIDGTRGDIIISNSGNTWSVADDVINDDNLTNTGVTAGTYTLSTVTVNAQGRILSASSGSVSSGASVETDELSINGSTLKIKRLGGTATTYTNPSNGLYVLTNTEDSTILSIDVFANQNNLDGFAEFTLRIDNTANSEDLWFTTQVFNLTTNTLSSHNLTVPRQTVNSSITNILIPGANGYGAAGFKLLLR